MGWHGGVGVGELGKTHRTFVCDVASTTPSKNIESHWKTSTMSPTTKSKYIFTSQGYLVRRDFPAFLNPGPGAA